MVTSNDQSSSSLPQNSNSTGNKVHFDTGFTVPKGRRELVKRSESKISRDLDAPKPQRKTESAFENEKLRKMLGQEKRKRQV